MTISEVLKNNDKKLSYQFSFDLNTNFIELVLFVLKSNPLKLELCSMSVSGYLTDSPIIISELEGYLYETTATYYSFCDKNKYIVYNIFRNFHKYGGSYQLIVTINKTHCQIDLQFEWVQNLNFIFPFIVGYAYDKIFVELQSNSQPISMRNYNIGLSEYKNQLFTNELGHEELDLTQNYARQCLVGSMWLMASWRMYITYLFESRLGHKFLLPDIDIKSQKAQDILLIELYENVFESHLEKNMRILKQVRDLNKFDEVEMRDNK